MLSKARQALADTFLRALHEDEIPWRKCWDTVRPQSFSTGKTYRGVNNLMLSYTAREKGYKDPRWMTFKQAEDNGWHVRRGERASRVEYWHYYDTAQKKSLDIAEVRRIQREEPDRMKNLRLTAYTYAVFNAEQIKGVPVWKPVSGNTHAELLVGRRDTLLNNLGIGFQEAGNSAFYNANRDVITMPPLEQFYSDYGYACSLLHEAGHATGHSSRLDRPMGNQFGTPAYAKEELRAEIASAFVSQTLGLPLKEEDLAAGVEQHKAYIQSWIQVLENEPNELFAAIKDADKISDYLLEHGKLQELVTDRESNLALDQDMGLAEEEVEMECL